jgi:predicted nuclease of predicted toxin-antitoxin system
LTPVFGECVHVDNIGLAIPAKDTEIWKYAKENDYIIVTKDKDFVDLLEIYDYQPKIILLRTGNNSSKSLQDLLISNQHSIQDLVENEYGLLEIVKRKT